MKHPVIVGVIAANLLALVALCFIYPEFMVGPGPLIKGHAELANDCFACHTPWRGAASARCVQCHALPDIGLRTSKGAPLPPKDVKQQGLKTAFHQDLTEQDCMACHSDHAGPKLTQRSRKPFSHDLLRAAVQTRCDSCHAKPTDGLHRDLSAACGSCHTVQRWQPATFKHSLLDKAVLARCETCHRAPADTLHRQFKGECGSCHGQDKWKPATFEHGKWFELDRDHDAECATCHTGNNYQRYTCYGCHEHTPANIRSEHVEEGITDYENCVECHRNARDEPRGKHGGGREGGKREGGKRERD